MGGILARMTVCAYCGDVIRKGVPPVSHGCCVQCFRARLWDDDGDAMLTVDEIGPEQFEKAKTDRARFRGIPGNALMHARERGGECVRMLKHLPAAIEREDEMMIAMFVRDAVMFAGQAFRGWRAYRIMKG